MATNNITLFSLLNESSQAVFMNISKVFKTKKWKVSNKIFGFVLCKLKSFRAKRVAS